MNKEQRAKFENLLVDIVLDIFTKALSDNEDYFTANSGIENAMCPRKKFSIHFFGGGNILINKDCYLLDKLYGKHQILENRFICFHRVANCDIPVDLSAVVAIC